MAHAVALIASFFVPIFIIGLVPSLAAAGGAIPSRKLIPAFWAIGVSVFPVFAHMNLFLFLTTTPSNISSRGMSSLVWFIGSEVLRLNFHDQSRALLVE